MTVENSNISMFVTICVYETYTNQHSGHKTTNLSLVPIGSKWLPLCVYSTISIKP